MAHPDPELVEPGQLLALYVPSTNNGHDEHDEDDDEEDDD
jgi:hypothetical protein